MFRAAKKDMREIRSLVRHRLSIVKLRSMTAFKLAQKGPTFTQNWDLTLLAIRFCQRIRDSTPSIISETHLRFSPTLNSLKPCILLIIRMGEAKDVDYGVFLEKLKP
jgi:hypothetical protein